METFGPADFDALTDGWVDARMLQNWRANHEWLTPTPPGPAGSPYPHSLQHLIEAALVAEMNKLGLDQKRARAAIQNRLFSHAALLDHDEREKKGNRRRRVALWADQISEAIMSIPEFVEPGQWFWVTIMDPIIRGRTSVPVATLVVDGNERLQEVLGRTSSALVLNITKIIQRVDELRRKKQAA